MDKKVKLKKPFAFEWDKGDKEKNVIKHKIQNSESEEVFVNNPILLIDITHSQAENRYLAYGVTDKKRQLVIAFTLRGENEEKIRIISSREQDKKEKELYQKMKSEVRKKK
jgi:uncharacterized DUF497 family protein